MASNKEQLNNSIEVKEELQQSSDKNSQPGIKRVWIISGAVTRMN